MTSLLIWKARLHKKRSTKSSAQYSRIRPQLSICQRFGTNKKPLSSSWHQTLMPLTSLAPLRQLLRLKPSSLSSRTLGSPSVAAHCSELERKEMAGSFQTLPLRGATVNEKKGKITLREKEHFLVFCCGWRVTEFRRKLDQVSHSDKGALRPSRGQRGLTQWFFCVFLYVEQRACTFPCMVIWCVKRPD